MAATPERPLMTYAPLHQRQSQQLQIQIAAPGKSHLFPSGNTSTHSPVYPPPVHPFRPTLASSHEYRAGSQDSALLYQQSPSYPPSALSTTPLARTRHGSVLSTCNPQADLERGTFKHQPDRTRLDREARDLKKYKHHSMSSCEGMDGRDGTNTTYQEDETDSVDLSEKTFRILIYLSGPCGFLSLFILLWTVFSVFLALFLQPLRLCSNSSPFSERLASFLLPSLKLQLYFIYCSSPVDTYNLPLLVIVHIFSPAVALGVAIASWTAAVFWFYAAIIGDPGSKDGHNDGKAAVLGVRAWWEGWLTKALMRIPM